MKITEALLAEHVVFHNIFDYIERVLPDLKTLAEVKSLAELMESLLGAHGKAEEDLVFAPLDHCLEQIGQRRRMTEVADDLLHNPRAGDGVAAEFVEVRVRGHRVIAQNIGPDCGQGGFERPPAARPPR